MVHDWKLRGEGASFATSPWIGASVIEEMSVREGERNDGSNTVDSCSYY